MTYSFTTRPGQGARAVIPTRYNLSSYALSVEYDDNSNFNSITTGYGTVTYANSRVTLDLSASDVDALKDTFFRIKAVGAFTFYVTDGFINYVPLTDEEITVDLIDSNGYIKDSYLPPVDVAVLDQNVSSVVSDTSSDTSLALRAAFDARYARIGASGGATPAAAASPFGGTVQAPQNGPVYTRKIHVATVGGSDFRFRYAQPLANDIDGTLQPVTVHAALEYPLFRRVTDGVVTNNSATITSASANFTPTDVGRQVLGANIPAGATISSVTNSTTAVLSANAAGSGSSLPLDVGGTIYPVTFSGKALGALENGAVGLVSDPVPAEIPTGAQFASRQFVTSQFGVYTTLTAAASAGASSIQLNTLPGAATNPNGLPGDIVVDAGGNAEKVTIVSYSGSAGAWIAALSPATPLTKAHSNGAIVGGQVFYNCYPDAGLGEHGVVGSATDYVLSAIPTTPGTTNTTTTAAASIGDKKITTAASPIGTSITIDTAGNTETATVVNVVGEANPYTVYLAAPLTIAHGSGVTVSSGRMVGGICPTLITADKVTATAPPLVIIRGDSIADSVGYNVRNARSFATEMFDGHRPYIKTTKSGEAAYQFAKAGVSRRRRQFDHLAGWLFYQYVTNDIWGARSLAQVQADAATIIGWAKQRGLKCMMATCLPRTTSTDGWATTANQTKNVTFEPVRLSYNTWVRGGAGGLADAVFDGCQVLDSGLAASSAETGLWVAADASKGPYTASGLHPSYLGHQALATYGQTLLTLIV